MKSSISSNNGFGLVQIHAIYETANEKKNRDKFANKTAIGIIVTYNIEYMIDITDYE